jgi:excinuclease UvrABC ATPase subunit
VHRYSVSVESKGKTANTLEEALSVFNGMMTIDKQQVKKDLLEKGESYQVYGFCTGYIADNQFSTVRKTTCTDCDACGEITIVDYEASLCDLCMKEVRHG